MSNYNNLNNGLNKLNGRLSNVDMPNTKIVLQAADSFLGTYMVLGFILLVGGLMFWIFGFSTGLWVDVDVWGAIVTNGLPILFTGGFIAIVNTFYVGILVGFTSGLVQHNHANPIFWVIIIPIGLLPLYGMTLGPNAGQYVSEWWAIWQAIVFVVMAKAGMDHLSD